MPILNYTTTIDAHKTLAEVQAKLAKKGARAIMIGYENGLPTSLAFEFVTSASGGIQRGPLRYRLPCRHEAILALLRREAQPRYRTPQHALNVAWRILKDWCEAQFALIDAGMVAPDEVFLPYMLTSAPDGPELTMYERAVAHNLLTVKE